MVFGKRRKFVQARAEGKFICTFPREAKLARSERLFEWPQWAIRLASPTTGCARLQFASKGALYSLARSFRSPKNHQLRLPFKKRPCAELFGTLDKALTFGNLQASLHCTHLIVLFCRHRKYGTPLYHYMIRTTYKYQKLTEGCQ